MNSRSLPLFVTLVVLLGGVVLTAGILSWSNEDVVLLLALVALVVVSEAFCFTPFPGSRVSVSMALILAAGMLSGLPGVAVVAPSVALASYAIHRKPFIKVLFNLGTLVLAGASYVGVLEVFSSTYNPQDWAAMLGPVVLGALAAFAVNSVLVSLAIALDTRATPFSVWSTSFRWVLPHYVMLAMLALLIATAYDRWQLWGLALLMGPLAMAWLIMKQYTDRITAAAPLTAEHAGD